MSPPRVFLIDGSSYVYRAFFAVRSLATSKGMPTNAVFGFTNMLLKVIKAHQPEAVAVVFDAPGPTFRDELYKDYKATRDAAPEDLMRQVPYIKKIPDALNVAMLEVKGVEADDVLGTLSCQALAAGWDVLIVTGDKDFMQLVTKKADAPEPGIRLYDDMKERWIGIDEVVEKFGVPPEKVVDVLALIGDTSDNIPGVRGIGPKFAAELIQQCGSVEEILKDVSKCKSRFRAALEAGRQDAVLSKTLATIRRDVPVRFDPERFARRDPDREKLSAVFRELEFTKLLRDIDAEGPKAQTFTPEKYRLILDRPALDALVKEVSTARALAVDVRAGSPDPMRAEIAGIALCAAPGEAAYVPTGHAYLGAPSQLSKIEVLAALKPVLENPAIRKIGQNEVCDALLLRRNGVELAPLGFDTRVGAYLLDPDRGPFNLDTLAKKWLGHDMISDEELRGSGRERVPFHEVPVERAKDFCAEAVDAAFRLAPLLEARVREDGLGPLLDSMELPLLCVLADLQANGVKIDVDYFAALGRDFDKRLSGILLDLHRIAGEPFNPDSPKQLQRILFEKLQLDSGKRTKTGYSTDASVLEKLAVEHEFPRKLLEHRSLAKLKGTYIDALPRLVNPETGRIHTTYNQAVAATGRLSSNDPNLQNIPVRTAEGRLIRKGFIPEPGRVLVSADYSQIELRVLAEMSGDERLRAAFRDGEDVHAATAKEVFGESNPENRSRAKAINFGIVYGMSGFGLSQRLGIDGKTAQDYIDRYFARYPGVKAWLAATIEAGKRDGYVKTMFGRRRYVPDLRSSNRVLAAAAERVAVNAPIQGTAADLMKIAMIRVAEKLRGSGAPLILQVHDELVLEAPEGKREELEAVARAEMEAVHPMSVPLKVDVSRGPNWADLS